MHQRDDFTEKTKKTLAERVAWNCSYPKCGIATVGPNLDSDDKSTNIGEAAHIAAASPGGPRYDPTMTPAERKSINNGIWMCRHHAKFVDSNECAYSADTLKLWKNQAEYQALEKIKLPLNKQLSAQTTLIQL